ncbi:MAG: SpoVR family protein, partial [Calditrichaeota bacterium]|nr:SpoVR family protein [Calditrichota bacterium]
MSSGSITLDDIKRIQPGIEKISADYGLDFFPVVFELVDYDTISQLAAYGGFPVRYPHWRFGME